MKISITAPVGSDFEPGTEIIAMLTGDDHWTMYVGEDIFDYYFTEDVLDLIRKYCSPIG